MSLLVVCCVEQFVFTCAALHVGLTAGRVMDYSPVRYVTNREVIPLLVCLLYPFSASGDDDLLQSAKRPRILCCSGTTSLIP
ncbi:uncharacterized protein BKA78DRAFT_10059 [Phyllosticta capitalensis]|uniref:uncharacterized protein n=1 Tax=Phyllosticta capitalensis TaxID=121624 RepID=UPI00313039DE